MAEPNLTTCRDCGESVSNKAKTCPHCGTKKPWKQPRKRTHPAIIVLIVLAILALVGQVVVEKLTPPTNMYVHAELANLLESASTDAPVVMQLKKGHYLIVLEKQGPWYLVSAHRTRGKAGWIHSSVIGANDPGGNPIYVED